MPNETTKAKTARDVGITIAERMKERMADPRAIWGLPWPYKGLNKLTGGIHRGELAICTARPSVGKTTVMVQCADSVIEHLLTPEGKREYPGGIVKLVLCESTAEVFMRRWACLRSGVSQRRVQDGSIRKYPEQAEKFLAELRLLASLPIEILDSAQSIDEITSWLGKGNTVWWGLDYVQKCPLYVNKPNDGGVQAVTIISGALTEVAKRKAPGLALAHTPREVDKREDRRPRMGDIKGGSALEGDARVVLGLYRERIYERVAEEESSLPHPAELLLLKQNEGESGHTIELVYYPKKGKFEDISELMLEEDED